ncbi:MAG: hypothetical protein KF763_00395 [Cyclobacteriaceae bacterium]|nr:hypothetical protein [Cyclobacteriaceae bacterium]
MKKLLIILIATLVSCQAKKETTTATSGGTSGILDYLKEDSNIEFVEPFNCLILPPAEIYPDSIIDNTLPDIIKVIPANWISKTTGLYSYASSSDLCGKFPLFQFQFSTGSKGWVHGSQVFLTSQEIATVTLQNILYQLNMATSTGIGTATDEGTTGCSEYQLLYLTDNSNKLIHLVSVNPALQNLAILGNTNQQWFSYLSDEGMAVTIKSATVLNNQIVIDHSIEYQEGSREGKMYLSKEENHFVIAKIDAGAMIE